METTSPISMAIPIAGASQRLRAPVSVVRRMTLARGAVMNTSRSPHHTGVKAVATMPWAPRAGTPTPETTNPAGTISGVTVGIPASAITRPSPTRMMRAPRMKRGTMWAGIPDLNSQYPISPRPATRPATAPRYDRISSPS